MAVIAIAAIWKVNSTPHVSVATAAVTSGIITRPIVATGTLEPVTTVEIGSQISGTVQSLGADTVIDYTKEDFTKTGQTYDIIFDAVGKSSFSRCRSSLTGPFPTFAP